MLRRSERHILWPNPAEILVFSKGLAHFYLLQLAGRSKSGRSWSAVLWLHIMRVTSLARLAPTDAWSLKSKLTWQILCNPNLRGNYHRLQGGVVTSIKRRKNKKQGYFYPQSGQTIAALWSAFLISYSSQMIYFFLITVIKTRTRKRFVFDLCTCKGKTAAHNSHFGQTKGRLHFIFWDLVEKVKSRI